MSRAADSVPVEGDRPLVTRAPPHYPQRARGQVRWPACPGPVPMTAACHSRPRPLQSPGRTTLVPPTRRAGCTTHARQMSVLAAARPRWRADRLGPVRIGGTVLRLAGLLIKRGDLGQAIRVLCTRAAARTRAARAMSVRGTRLAHAVSFRDDFEGRDLDRSVWIPHYLPQWSSRAESAATYEVTGSELRLSIPPGQGLWCPAEHDGPLRVSGIQSGVFSGEVGR